jgi:hypothetical protein
MARILESWFYKASIGIRRCCPAKIVYFGVARAQDIGDRLHFILALGLIVGDAAGVDQVL